MRLVTFRAHPAAAARLGALAEGYVIDLALLGQAGGAWRCRTTCWPSSTSAPWPWRRPRS